MARVKCFPVFPKRPKRRLNVGMLYMLCDLGIGTFQLPVEPLAPRCV